MRTKREQLRQAKTGTPRRAGPALPANLPAAVPEFIPPMQCKLVRTLPNGEAWRYELKLDGYRALAVKKGARVTLISRNHKDLTAAYPEVVEDLGQLPLAQGVLDGEIVALDRTGKPSFQALQHAGRAGGQPRPIFYFAFDLLNYESSSLLTLPLLERKQLLEALLEKAPNHVRLAGFLGGDAATVAAEICKHNLEGVVAKLAHSVYEPDKRSGAWVKWKCGYEQEFVIGGYTVGSGGRASFGALVVGYYDAGRLRFASKVGTGFSNAQIRELLALAKPFRQDKPPFDKLPVGEGGRWSYGLTTADLRSAVWLKPVLVCRVRFTEWTLDGHLRHPAFEGLRSDKEAKEVVRETAADKLPP